MGPLRLWRLSAALRRRGHRRLALLVKKVNSLIYHNSLAPGASFSSDIRFGHHGFGTVIHSNVEIGKRVLIWHNVTIAVYAASSSPDRVVIEDEVMVGANSVIVCPKGRSIRIGRGARIGAGAVVSRDVPAGATVVSAPARVIGHEHASHGDPERDDSADGAPVQAERAKGARSKAKSSAVQGSSGA